MRLLEGNYPFSLERRPLFRFNGYAALRDQTAVERKWSKHTDTFWKVTWITNLISTYYFEYKKLKKKIMRSEKPFMNLLPGQGEESRVNLNQSLLGRQKCCLFGPSKTDFQWFRGSLYISLKPSQDKSQGWWPAISSPQFCKLLIIPGI